MPVSFKEEKKKQKLLILIVIAAIVITIIILWFGVFSKKSNLNIVEIKPESLIQEINVDFNVLNDPIFDDLKIFEEIPKFEGEIGRENPFLAY